MISRAQRFIYAVTVSLSAAGHLMVYEVLGSAAAEPRPQRPPTLEMALVEQKPPRRVPPPPPPPPKEKKVKPPPKPLDLSRVKPPPKAPPPPPNTSQANTPPSKARPVFGISMSSVVSAGGAGMQVAVGNTLMKEPDKEHTPAAEVQPYQPQKMRMPRVLREHKVPYPPEARRQGLEGQVTLEVEVLVDGRVGRVRVLRGLSPTLDQVAVQAMKHYVFEPAHVGDEPVSTRIRYVYTFVIES